VCRRNLISLHLLPHLILKSGPADEILGVCDRILVKDWTLIDRDIIAKAQTPSRSDNKNSKKSGRKTSKCDKAKSLNKKGLLSRGVEALTNPEGVSVDLNVIQQLRELHPVADPIDATILPPAKSMDRPIRFKPEIVYRTSEENEERNLSRFLISPRRESAQPYW
jgi:hypothetical protein